MGAWGYGIRQDDFVRDVIGVFEDLLKAGKNVREATEAVRSKFAAEMKDADDGPLFWIALADMQWTYGELEPQILNRVKDDLDSGRSLAPWTEDQRGLARRRAALEKFISKIGQPNRRPKKPPKIVVRAPKFQPGDCLSIRLSNGQYAGALVLAADHSNVEYGTNLIGVLDYLSPEKPTMEVFGKRKWLVLSQHSSNKIDAAWYHYIGFLAVKDRIEIVGRVEILSSDPTDSTIYRRWTGIGEQAIRQREGDAEHA
ncbi:MAG: hypothetical protein ACM335_12545 [Deltaproteobacteria bacterium]